MCDIINTRVRLFTWASASARSTKPCCPPWSHSLGRGAEARATRTAAARLWLLRRRGGSSARASRKEIGAGERGRDRRTRIGAGLLPLAATTPALIVEGLRLLLHWTGKRVRCILCPLHHTAARRRCRRHGPSNRPRRAAHLASRQRRATDAEEAASGSVAGGSAAERFLRLLHVLVFGLTSSSSSLLYAKPRAVSASILRR